jgi:hypothetical protein
LAAIQRMMPSGAQVASIQHVPSNDVEDGTGEQHLASSLLPMEQVRTAPLSAPTDLAFWPGGEVPMRDRATPIPPSRANGYGYHAPAQPVAEAPFFEESPAQPVPRYNEIPPRRSALLPNEHFTRHPGWEPGEQMFEPSSDALPAYVPMPTTPATTNPSQRTPAQPSRSVGSRSIPGLPTQPAKINGSRSAPNLPVQPAKVNGSRSAPNLPTQPAKMNGSRSAPSLPTQPTKMNSSRSAPDMPPLRPLPPAQQASRPRRGFSPMLLLLSLLILAGAGLGSFVVITRAMPSVPAVAQPVGTISFVSSEQLNENTSQGINDEIQITLHSLGNPATGKSYYAWLLGDKNQTESESIPLGKLTIANGSASLLYRGDAQHTNLLQVASRFLVTEEDSGATPLLPSPDTNAWRYYGAIPATPDPNDPHHFAFLNHLRHLLADEPILDEMELPGGLNNWFTLNTQALVQWTSNARDQWQNNNFTEVRNQGIRILSYLDGMSFLVQDLPPASVNAKPTLDTRLASLGLINIRGAGQNPPSYMDQLAYHLNGLINAPGSPSNIRSIAIGIQPVMSYVNTWLENLRNDDKQLLALGDDQLSQQTAFSLLDDMVFQANNAYTGNTDPSTGQFKSGVSWIHQQLQAMATINISTYVTTGNSVPEIGPSSSNTSSTFLQPIFAEVKRLLEGL